MSSAADEALVREYHGRVRGFVRLRVPDGDVDDVVAEVFLRALERRGQLRGGDPGPWLLQIARSRVAEHFRARAVRAATVPEEARPVSRPPPTPLDELARDEFRGRLRRQLAGLPEVERDLIALKFTEGISNVQIAETLGVTANHLGVMLHRALGRLRQALLEDVGDGIP